jgi:hypothetical protein
MLVPGLLLRIPARYIPLVDQSAVGNATGDKNEKCPTSLDPPERRPLRTWSAGWQWQLPVLFVFDQIPARERQATHGYRILAFYNAEQKVFWDVSLSEDVRTIVRVG